MAHTTQIIAEAGVNHNGSVDMALKLVERAADAGADFVKFQTFVPEQLASTTAQKAAYQVRTTGQDGGQLSMLRQLRLSHEAHVAVHKHCADCGIGFLSSPFDRDSLLFLTNELGCSTLKLGSGELTNAPLLLAAARSDATIILSTGMGTLSEVEEALGVIAFGLTNKSEPQRRSDFTAALACAQTRKTLKEKVTLLHCTTEYPAAVEDTNLRAMDTMRAAFGLRVGYSDHTNGRAVSLAAVARGACVLEKHFTLDRNLPGPDHAASLEPEDLSKLVAEIRMVEDALGDGMKQPSEAEVANRSVARKSLHVTRNLPAGHMLTLEDLAAKRPGDGQSPMLFWDALGTAVPCDLEADDKLP